MCEVEAVNACVARYGKALSDSDVATVMDCYDKDGIFYGYNVPVARGHAQIKPTYEMIFKKIKLNVNFQFDGTCVSGNLATVLTSSAGIVKIIAPDVEVPEANRELFYMRKDEGGAWKIQTYMFNKAAEVPADPEGANGKDEPHASRVKFSLVEEEVNVCVAAYGKALSASDAGAVVQQYAKDGLFFGNNLPLATGSSELRTTYENIFKMIQLNVSFKFEGTFVGNGDEPLAVVITSSAGKVKILEPGVEVPEANRELFFVKKEEGQWKIATYMFNKAAAPQGPSDP